MPQPGIDSATVPGVVDGWQKLHGRFGKLPWHKLFQPVTFNAEHGYPVPEIIHDYWKTKRAALMQNHESRRNIWIGGNDARHGVRA
jgi:gamma-glutamyltranspeptidase/glutathione hydrolase